MTSLISVLVLVICNLASGACFFVMTRLYAGRRTLARCDWQLLSILPSPIVEHVERRSDEAGRLSIRGELKAAWTVHCPLFPRGQVLTDVSGATTLARSVRCAVELVAL
jgi:hypothetical protein